MKSLSDSLTKNIEGRIGLDDLSHCLSEEESINIHHPAISTVISPDQRLHSGTPVTVCRIQIVSQIDSDENSSGRRIDGHVICRVIEELCTSISLNIVRVVISPSQLNIQPILLSRRIIHHIPEIEKSFEYKYKVLTWNQEEGKAEIHSICIERKEEYQHKMNSSCMISLDESSPFVLSESPMHPILDRTP